MAARQKSESSQVKGHGVFIKEFLKHPLQIGSVIPSSCFLEQRVVEAAGVASAQVIIELGPGTGGITHAILHAMPRQAKLLTVEINSVFNELLGRIEDDRLVAHLGSASELRQIVAKYDLDPPDTIISGIPFSTMSQYIGSQIIEAVSSLLTLNGRFVAYQVNNQVATLCNPVLGPGKIFTEFLNIPPMRIFQWVKKA